MNDKKQSSGNGEANEPRSPQVGALLRASRLRVGEDLREIADALCIRYLYLDAIEECRYAELPGDTYAIGFIRSYAEHLGLDGEEVVRRYRAEQAGSKRSNDLSFPTPVAESGVPKGAIVFIGVLLALLIYGGWYISTTDESILTDLISPVPDHLKHMVTGDDAASNGNQSAPSKESDAATQMAATSSEVAERTAEAARAAAEEAARAVTEASEAVQEAVEAETPATAPEAASTPASSAPQPTVSETPPTATSTSAPPAVSVAEPAQTATDKKRATQPAAQIETPAPTPAAPTAVSETTTAVPAEAPEPSNETQAVPTEAPAEAEPASDEATPPAAPDGPTATAVETEAQTDSQPSETESVTAGGSTAETVTAEDLNALSLKNATSVLTAPPAPTRSSVTEVASVPSTGMFVRANDSSWVEIRNPESGRVVYTGLMSAGTTFKVPNDAGLILDTGNAGGLDIIIDGTTVPKIGGVGTVRKGVALDAERLKAGTAVNR